MKIIVAVILIGHVLAFSQSMPAVTDETIPAFYEGDDWLKAIEVLAFVGIVALCIRKRAQLTKKQ